MVEYRDSITVDDYMSLRATTGWAELTRAQCERGLEHTTYVSSAYAGDTAVGMARLIFDFSFTAYLCDVIVRPEYQRRGIGSAMLNRIFEFVEKNSDPGDYIKYTLVAAKGKEPFYEKHGFTRRPTDELGCGMTK